MSSPERAAPTFEEALDELEDAVSRLESGELTLDESLQIFERGIAASRVCGCLLDKSRERVRVLVEKAGGEFELEFLDPDHDPCPPGDGPCPSGDDALLAGEEEADVPA